MNEGKKYISGIVFFLLWMGGFSFSQPLNHFKPGAEPDGFEGIKWGTDLSTLKNMKLSRVDPSYGGIDIYLRLGEGARIGKLELRNVEYLFWKGKLSGVSFIAEGASESESLKEAIFEVFGKGSKPNRGQEYFVWDGESTLMALEFYLEGRGAVFRMMHKPILNRMELEEK